VEPVLKQLVKSVLQVCSSPIDLVLMHIPESVRNGSSFVLPASAWIQCVSLANTFCVSIHATRCSKVNFETQAFGA